MFTGIKFNPLGLEPKLTIDEYKKERAWWPFFLGLGLILIDIIIYRDIYMDKLL